MSSMFLYFPTAFSSIVSVQYFRLPCTPVHLTHTYPTAPGHRMRIASPSGPCTDGALRTPGGPKKG